MRGAYGGLVFFAFATVATVAGPASAASPAPSASAAPSAPVASPTAPAAIPDDAAAAARAREWLGRLQRGDLDRGQLADDLSHGLGDDAVAALAQLLGPLGPPKRFVLRSRNVGTATADWVYRVSWPSATYAYTFGIDRVSGKIDELYVAPDAPAS